MYRTILLKKSKSQVGVLCLLIINGVQATSSHAANDDIKFDTSFLDTKYTSGVDLNRFNLGNTMQAGEYLADVWLNDDLVGTEKVLFSKLSDGRITACLSPSMLVRLNVKQSSLNNAALLSEKQCSPVEQIIPSARLSWDASQQKLTIAIPQNDLEKTARGSVPPSVWQDGDIASFVSYNASSYQSQSGGKTYSSQYVNINSGINIDGWYARHNGSFINQMDNGSRYQSTSTYIKHDITQLRGRFLAGQSNTSGRLFDSVGFTGVSLFSDDLMLPESQRGYAPEVRGIAKSHARVTIVQGGNIIYETNVPPGAFVINDLYPTGYGGDLNVIVREADGSEHTYLVPYASVADLLRPGAYRYEAVAGKYRQPIGKSGQPFYQGTWQQGINNILTLYGGLQLSEGYQAYLTGAAISMPIGAMAFDATHSDTQTANDDLSGQSYRITYNKMIYDTKSNITLAAYRFSSKNYLDFSQAMQYLSLDKGNSVYADLLYRVKNRYSLTLSQGLSDDLGTISFTGLSQNYWNQAGNNMQYQLGYSNRWKRIGYSLTAARNRTQSGKMEASWLISFTLPLGEERPVSFNASVSHDRAGGLGEQVSLAGTAGERQQLSWGASANKSNLNGSSGSLSGQYISPWTNMYASASSGRNNRTLSAGLSGAIVAHPFGVTLTPYTSDTWVVVNAPGASGAEVSNYPGLTLDYWSNAVMPATMPYQRNIVSLDPSKLPQTVELESTSRNVVPRAGAVVVAEFASQKGYALLLTSQSEESGLPFGIAIKDGHGRQVGMAGQGGMAYARVNDTAGKLFVTLNQTGRKSTCVIPYSINKSISLQKITYSCN